MTTAFLSIGTNIGEREQNLQDAIKLLLSNKEITVTAISSIYETAAVGFTEQADFLNIAVAVETSLNAFELLTQCQKIENDLGRVREFRWGPRIIDLDILLYNNEKYETENLIVPHPRMFERAFVLVPLEEIMTQKCGMLVSVQKALLALDIEKEGVKLWKKIATVEEFVPFES
ncbi:MULTISPECIES: 2-amino-4-hydroxy-6-hydroxymethyldihydropteridine diphosphokinase [Solibacillus]|uniref:2-amino-4-hydroxy-6-hydroxymethyldihydropteridine diphosphokinase n=1 Tax=Solibacillus merdavium TaxID=2762218 RepID=A0ABR8XS96_9BACL|nr:2-amino-4-hydroxy-6-hydroxymethyldihydropteridine diphosphokinase [Solibacillus merdavium]MBD8034821.1 2-amino-4-hydroxy-6-hydroxymethyldihydropteridine diphosphokinase [Solibacillus merdavium]